MHKTRTDLKNLFPLGFKIERIKEPGSYYIAGNGSKSGTLHATENNQSPSDWPDASHPNPYSCEWPLLRYFSSCQGEQSVPSPLIQRFPASKQWCQPPASALPSRQESHRPLGSRNNPCGWSWQPWTSCSPCNKGVMQVHKFQLLTALERDFWIELSAVIALAVGPPRHFSNKSDTWVVASTGTAWFMLTTLNGPTEICFTDGMAIETNWEVNTMMAVLCTGNLSVLILDFLDGCIGPWQPWPPDTAEQDLFFI